MKLAPILNDIDFKIVLVFCNSIAIICNGNYVPRNGHPSRGYRDVSAWEFPQLIAPHQPTLSGSSRESPPWSYSPKKGKRYTTRKETRNDSHLSKTSWKHCRVDRTITKMAGGRTCSYWTSIPGLAEDTEKQISISHKRSAGKDVLLLTSKGSENWNAPSVGFAVTQCTTWKTHYSSTK